MIEFTKLEKRELRRLAGDAYKAEMEREVSKLEAAFQTWRSGKIDVIELDDQIHTYYSGPRKQLYGFYQLRNQPEAAVARGIAMDLIDAAQVPTEVKIKIEHMIAFFKENS
ncbi:MAG: hypothetical protein ACK5WZ_10875 [Pseudobdellovibrionaceae bacterium]